MPFGLMRDKSFLLSASTKKTELEQDEVIATHQMATIMKEAAAEV